MGVVINDDSSTFVDEVFDSENIAYICKGIGDLASMEALDHCTERALKCFNKSEMDHTISRPIDESTDID